MKNTDLHVKTLESITEDISVRKSVKNYGAFNHMLHQIKAPQYYTDLGLQNSVESSC